MAKLTEDRKLKMREYYNKFCKTPEYRKKKEYQQKPEIKAKAKKYYETHPLSEKAQKKMKIYLHKYYMKHKPINIYKYF
jgi:hypothetical protein